MLKPNLYRGRLLSKTAIVTGAGASADGDGIGTAVAIELAGEGANLCIVDRDAKRTELTRQRIENQGGKAFVAVAHVSEDGACASVVDVTVEKFGRVDVLVNNAGVTASGGPLETLDLKVWQRTMDINLRGAVQMSRHAVRAMAKEGGGSIVHIASIAALRSQGTGFAYGPSKGAMISLSQDIAVAYGRAGIRSNVVCPGHMFTPIVGQLDPGKLAARRKVSPPGIEGTHGTSPQQCCFSRVTKPASLRVPASRLTGGVMVTAPLKGHELIQA